MSIGENIKQRRRELNMTLEEVAVQMGISRQTLSRYETGVIGNIPSDRIEQLSRVLNTTPAHLMGWDEAPMKAAIEAQERLFQNSPPTAAEAFVGASFAMKEITEHITPDFTDIPEKNIGKVKKAYEFAMLAMRLSEDSLKQLITFAKFLDEKGGLENAITPPTLESPPSPPAPQEDADTTPPPDMPETPSEGEWDRYGGDRYGGRRDE